MLTSLNLSWHTMEVSIQETTVSVWPYGEASQPRL